MLVGARSLSRTAQVAALIFLGLAVVVGTGWAPVVEADIDIADALRPVVAARAWLVDLLLRVSEVCHPTTFRVLAAVGSGLLWWRSRRGGAGCCDPAGTRRLAVFVLVTVGVGGLLASGCKELVGRARPAFADPLAHAAGLSFPSGHALGVMVAGVVCLAVYRAVRGRRPPAPWWAAVAGIVALTGFARLGLGVHYLTDVIGGYLLGAAWALGMVVALAPWRAQR